MTTLDPLAGTLHALAQTGLTLTHSLRARGGRRTIELAALAFGLPALAEHQLVNRFELLRHHAQPQMQGVPLLALLSWYNVTYPSFALVEGLLAAAPLSPSARRWATPVGSALVATSIDLLLDVVGLEQGIWEWSADGPYAPEISGPNGKRGIPLLNFVGWLGLVGSVTAIDLLRHPAAGADTASAGNASSAAATRTAALLLLPYYGVGAASAVRGVRLRTLAYSALAPAAIALGLTRRAT
jgi:uncharacterized membrane protein